MDRATLVTSLLCAATAVAYADELGLLAKAIWQRLFSAGPTELPADVIDMAAREIESDDPARIQRGLSVMRNQKGALATARLMPMLSHSNPEVSRRVAQLLFERQDPGAIEALYWYHARRQA